MNLQQLWGLAPPTAPDPAILARIEAARQAFVAAIEQTNVALRVIASSAPRELHGELIARRDKLFMLYGRIVATGASDLRAIDGLVQHVGRLADDARQAARDAQRDKQLWEQQAGTLNTTEDLIARTDDDAATDNARTQLEQAVEAAKSRQYASAVGQLRSASLQAQRLSTPGDAETPPVVNERRYPLAGPLPNRPTVPSDPRDLAAWQNPLVAVDPRELFSAERMDAVVDMHFQGEATPEKPDLNEAMRAVLFAAPGEDVAQHVAKIGELRGLTPEQIEEQFARFTQLQQVARDLEEARGLSSDPVFSTRRDEYLLEHGEFLGTRSSLRFGQVVGEATGLDPALAALLNPTGGMVGPGMDVLAPTDADSPIIWHGIFHDAGGYLLNYQNTGPGYTYLIEPESGRRGVDPVQGQVEGVSYWYERREPDRSLLEDMYAFDGEQMAYDAYIVEPIEQAEQMADGLTQDAIDEIRQLTREVDAAQRVLASETIAASRAMTERVDAATQDAEAAVDSLARVAEELGVDPGDVEATEEAIDARLASIRQEIAALDQAIAREVTAAAAEVERSTRALEQWSTGASQAVESRIAAWTDEAEASVHAELIALGQDEDLLEFARGAANAYGETMADLTAFRQDVDRKIAEAEALAAQLADAAAASSEQVNEQIEATRRELAAATEQALNELAEVRRVAEQGVAVAAGQADAARRQLEAAAQETRDLVVGVVDSLDEAVDGGVDAIAGVVSSATDFAAGRLERLTSLLG